MRFDEQWIFAQTPANQQRTERRSAAFFEWIENVFGAVLWKMCENWEIRLARISVASKFGISTYRNRLYKCQIRNGQILFGWRHRQATDHSFDVWIGNRWTISMEIRPYVKF